MVRVDEVLNVNRLLIDPDRGMLDMTKTVMDDRLKRARRPPRPSGVGNINLRGLIPKGTQGNGREGMDRLRRVFPMDDRTAQRRCIVKITYSGPLKRGSSPVAAEHPNADKIAYIARSPATVEQLPWHEDETHDTPLYTFNTLGQKVPMDGTEASGYIGDGPVFRIILSPEHGEECNLDMLARRFMEESFARALHMPVHRIRYVAANHWNTGSPHVHLIVSRSVFNHRRGEAWNDSLARYSGNYIRSKRALNDASRICTEIAGPRIWALDSVEERLRMGSPRFQPVDLHLMDMGRLRADGTQVISERDISRLSPKLRRAALDRLYALSRNPPADGMDVKPEVATDENGTHNRFVLSPGFWTKARIADGDSSIPVSRGEIRKVVFDRDGYEPEGTLLREEQDDASESMVWKRILGKDGRIHLAHVKDDSWKVSDSGERKDGINGTAAIPHEGGRNGRG